MPVKEYIRNKLERTCLQLRGIGKPFFLPLLVVYLVIPLITLHYQLTPTLQDETEKMFLELCHYFIPMSSTWWVFAIFKEYVEGDGNELLYMDGKSKLSDVLLLYVAYAVLLSPFFVAYYFFSSSFWFFFKILVVCFMYCGICYFFIYITKSIAVSFIPLLAYTIYANSNACTPFPSSSYCFMVEERGVAFLNELMPFSYVGITAFLFGYIANRYYTLN